MAELPMAPNVHWMDAYQQWLVSQPWLSPATKREYLSRARQLARFSGSANGNLVETAQAYLDKLRHDNFTEYRINGIATVLDQILRLHEEAAQQSNFFPENSEQHELGPAHIAALLQAIRASSQPRDAVLLLLMIKAGLSLRECRYLKAEDIINGGYELVARTWRNKRQRTVQLDRETRLALLAWLVSSERQAIESEYVFAASCSGPLSRTALDNQIRRIGLNIRLVVTPRMLQRAAFSLAGKAHENNLNCSPEIAAHSNMTIEPPLTASSYQANNAGA